MHPQGSPRILLYYSPRGQLPEPSQGLIAIRRHPGGSNRAYSLARCGFDPRRSRTRGVKTPPLPSILHACARAQIVQPHEPANTALTNIPIPQFTNFPIYQFVCQYLAIRVFVIQIRGWPLPLPITDHPDLLPNIHTFSFWLMP